MTGFATKGVYSAYCAVNDGGNNLYVKGVTNSSGSKYNDVCYGGGSGIRENWCNGNTSKTDVFDCKSLGNYVCSDGKCVAGTCTGSYVVGGATYWNVLSPLTSGVAGVVHTLVGSCGTFSNVTGTGPGIWSVSGVPGGVYTVNASKPGCSFSPVTQVINVNNTNQANQQSIQFVASCS